MMTGRHQGCCCLEPPGGPEVLSGKVCQLCQTPVAWKVAKGAWDQEQVPQAAWLMAVLESS